MTVQTPDGRSRSVQLRADDDDTTLSYPDTAQSGIYMARFGAPLNRTESFAVNVDTVESDLTQIDPEELQNEVWPDIPFVHQTIVAGFCPPPGRAVRSAAAAGCTSVCSIAVLGLLFVETFLGWKMGHR